MPHAPTTPPCQAAPTDPQQDPNATALPPNLAKILHLVQILLTYGRHIADTFARRSTAPGFHIIAKAFGTSRPAIILAHIRRGILRAAALERLLLDRAASGRDLTMPPLRVRIKPAAPQPPAAPAANPPEAPPARKPPPRPSWRDDWLDGVQDPLDPRHLPTFEDLLAQARRRPIGRTLGDIYTDLGIAPVLCLAPFWNDLFVSMMHYGGSPAIYDIRRWRREQEFEQEQERLPTLDRSWPKPEIGPGRGDILQALGFFIGQPPVEPAIIQPQQDPPPAPPAPSVPRPQAAWVKPPVPRTKTSPPAPHAAARPP